LKKTILVDFMTLPPLSLFFLAKFNWYDYVTIARFQCHKMDPFASI